MPGVVEETVIKSVRDADSLAEHKALRAPAPAGEQQPPKVETPPKEATPGSDEAAGTSKESTQDEGEKKRRDKSAEGRIAELTARAKKAEDELAELRKKSETTQVAQPATEEKKPVEAKPADDPEPKEEDFKTWAEYNRAAIRWEARQATKEAAKEREAIQQKTEAEKQQATIRESMNRKIGEARTKYEDFDAVTAGDAKANTGLVLTPAMSQFVIESDAGMDIAYHLGKNPEEYKRIAALSPARQIAELGKIEASLEKPPEKPKQAPVTKVTPPGRTVTGGATPPEPGNTSEARSLAEHKRLREAQRKTG